MLSYDQAALFLPPSPAGTAGGEIFDDSVDGSCLHAEPLPPGGESDGGAEAFHIVERASGDGPQLAGE